MKALEFVRAAKRDEFGKYSYTARFQSGVPGGKVGTECRIITRQVLHQAFDVARAKSTLSMHFQKVTLASNALSKGNTRVSLSGLNPAVADLMRAPNYQTTLRESHSGTVRRVLPFVSGSDGGPDREGLPCASL
jgi:hypothetical protein